MPALRDLIRECCVIHLPDCPGRTEAVGEMLGRADVPFRFSEGVRAGTHAESCSLAHLKALRSIRELPALVLEDDAACFNPDITLPEFPADADVIYLGVTPFGCLPRQRSYVRRFGHRAFFGLTLASGVDDNWLRLHSMSGGLAILYVSERGRQVWMQAMKASLRRRAPFDVFTAYAMNSLNVYAPRQPVFYESQQYQRPLVRVTPAHRLAWTSTPIRPRQEGEKQLIGAKNQFSAMVRRSESDELEWVLSEGAEVEMT